MTLNKTPGNLLLLVRPNSVGRFRDQPDIPRRTFMRINWLRVMTVTGVTVIVLLATLMLGGRIIFRQRLPGDLSAFTEATIQPGTQSAIEGQRHLVVVFHGLAGKPLND